MSSIVPATGHGVHWLVGFCPITNWRLFQSRWAHMLILHDFSSILCFVIKESFLIEISAKSVVLRFIAVLLFLLHYQLLTCQFHIGSFASSQPSNCEFFPDMHPRPHSRGPLSQPQRPSSRGPVGAYRPLPGQLFDIIIRRREHEGFGFVIISSVKTSGEHSWKLFANSQSSDLSLGFRYF